MFYKVSIHAPVRERLNFLIETVNLKRFNSRSREGATNLFVETINFKRLNSRSREGAT